MDEPELLPLSYLSQAGYCLRRAALIMNEAAWSESADTAKGRAEHERTHVQRVERRGDELKLYEYTVFSEQLKILGMCDCIEAQKAENGCKIPAAEFPVTLYPVEYKHGKVRDELEYNIQLCAQAMCLEEMFSTKIDEGAIFYITSHRRQIVKFTDELRQSVVDTARKLHEIRENFITAPAEYSAKCARCSLKDVCMPKVKTSAQQYCRELEREAKEVDIQ